MQRRLMALPCLQIARRLHAADGRGFVMATLQIRDLPDSLHQQLQQRARQHTAVSASRLSAICNRPVAAMLVSGAPPGPRQPAGLGGTAGQATLCAFTRRADPPGPLPLSWPIWCSMLPLLCASSRALSSVCNSWLPWCSPEPPRPPDTTPHLVSPTSKFVAGLRGTVGSWRPPPATARRRQPPGAPVPLILLFSTPSAIP